VCRGNDGSSWIVGYPEIAAASQGFNLCVSTGLFFVKLPAPPTGKWPEIAKASFAAGERDTFYGTRLDLDDAFGLVGRSTFMDQRAAQAGQPREPAPGSCPMSP
jgi:hypothetical protein